MKEHRRTWFCKVSCAIGFHNYFLGVCTCCPKVQRRPLIHRVIEARELVFSIVTAIAAAVALSWIIQNFFSQK